MNKKWVHKMIPLVMLLLVIIIFIVSFNYFQLKNIRNGKIVETNMNHDSNSSMTVTVSAKEEVKELQQENNNPDIQAILSIDNSSFKEPVVQTVDNEYYLTHDYSRQPDSLGAIYADYRVNLEAGRKILIFGHSSTKKYTPFNYLENYYDEDFYQNHKYITLKTQSNTYQYEIFSVYVETSDFTYMNMNFESNEDWYLHILKLQKKSLYSINIDLTEEEDILIMQTCSNNPKYKNYSKKYLLIVSRRVK